MLEILRVEDEENGGSTAVCYKISSHIEQETAATISHHDNK
jgi:hypothetical protein